MLDIPKKSASVQASQLLTHPKVQETIARLKAEQSKRTEITADKVLQAMADVAFGDIRGMFHFDGSLRACWQTD